jgi:RNA recognition motif-containing protein
MGNKVFVGGIPWAASDQDLRDLFSEIGEVTDAVILQDRETGKSRGFGFVTYASDDDAKSSVEKFNGHDFLGRELTVNEARPREERSGGGGGGGGGGGRGGYGGGSSGGRGGGGGGGGGGRRDGGNNKRARRDFEGGGGGW